MSLYPDDDERVSEPKPVSPRPLRRELGAVALAAAGLPFVRLPTVNAAPSDGSPVRRGFFSPHQLKTVEHLAEQIIPQDEHSPGAQEAEVAQTIDEYLAALYPRNPEHLERRATWRQGLARMDKDAKARFGGLFMALTPDQQYALVLSWSESPAADPRLAFFSELKSRVAWAYYTSAVGIHQDLGYLGNTYAAEFEGDDIGPPLAEVFRKLKIEESK